MCNVCKTHLRSSGCIHIRVPSLYPLPSFPGWLKFDSGIKTAHWRPTAGEPAARCTQAWAVWNSCTWFSSFSSYNALKKWRWWQNCRNEKQIKWRSTSQQHLQFTIDIRDFGYGIWSTAPPAACPESYAWTRLATCRAMPTNFGACSPRHCWCRCLPGRLWTNFPAIPSNMHRFHDWFACHVVRSSCRELPANLLCLNGFRTLSSTSTCRTP